MTSTTICAFHERRDRRAAHGIKRLVDLHSPGKAALQVDRPERGFALRDRQLPSIPMRTSALADEPIARRAVTPEDAHGVQVVAVGDTAELNAHLDPTGQLS